MDDDETYIARGVDDACVAIGLGVLVLMAQGAELVVVTRREGGGYVCSDMDSGDVRELRTRRAS